jgi:hypothetical protein
MSSFRSFFVTFGANPLSEDGFAPKNRKSHLFAAIVAGAALTAAGCAGVTSLDFPTPKSVPPDQATTTTVDLSGVTLRRVPGSTTSTVVVGPGRASLSGSVVGPGGPIPGAIVHVERIVGDYYGSVNVTTQPDGTWAVPNVLGGRYRVRGWRTPDLALTNPQIFFLSGTENKTMTVQLDQFNATNVSGAVAPNPPIVGQAANLVVQVTNQTVDDSGVVRGTPVPGATVQLTSASTGLTVAGDNPATTDSSGEVRWQIACESIGPQDLVFVLNNNTTNTYPYTLPACALPPATTTTTTTTTPGTGTSVP